MLPPASPSNIKAVFTLRKLDQKTGQVEIEPIMPISFTGIADTTFGPAKGEVLTCDVAGEERGEIKSSTGDTVHAVGIVLYCEHHLKIELRQVLFTPAT